MSWRGGGRCCPGDKCSSPQPDTLHFSPPRPPLPSVLFSKLFLVFVGVTVKVEILHRGQSDNQTSKQPFLQSPYSWCKYLPNISFPWTKQIISISLFCITFNLSPIFDTQLFRHLLKFILISGQKLPLFNWSSNIFWKWKWSDLQYPNILSRKLELRKMRRGGFSIWLFNMGIEA